MYHDLGTACAVEVEVSGYAVDGGRLAGYDGDVVGVCEGGHAAFGCGVETCFREVGEVWEDVVSKALGEVFWVEAIDADYYCWLTREGVFPAVEGEGAGGHGDGNIISCVFHLRLAEDVWRVYLEALGGLYICDCIFEVEVLCRTSRRWVLILAATKKSGCGLCPGRGGAAHEPKYSTYTI